MWKQDFLALIACDCMTASCISICLLMGCWQGKQHAVPRISTKHLEVHRQNAKAIFSHLTTAAQLLKHCDSPLIRRIRSTCGITCWIVSRGVAGFRTTPAFTPRSLICISSNTVRSSRKDTWCEDIFDVRTSLMKEHYLCEAIIAFWLHPFE